MKYINKIEVQGEVVKILVSKDDTVTIGVRIPTGNGTYSIHYCEMPTDKFNESPFRTMSCVHVTGSLEYRHTGLRVAQAVINVTDIKLVKDE